jgi:hypothetical protein
VIPIIRSLVALALLAVTLSGFAQEVGEPRFFIDRIEVRNAKRVSPDVVIYESRLKAGHEYSEADLSDAAVRLNRLPFLLSAEFSLDKGAERGHYVLVISIAETRPFFFDIDARPIISSNDGIVDPDYTDRLGSAEHSAVIGFRQFVGRRGAVHVGLTGRDDNRDFTRDFTAVVVGYTQYDLFGSTAFATVNIKKPIDTGDGGISPQIVAGIPISPNQTVTLTADQTRYANDRTVFGTAIERRDDERLFSARWTYNTTNDPFVPTSGTLVTVTPFMAWRDIANYNLVVVVGDPDEPFSPEVILTAYSLHMNSRGFDVAASHWYELNERDSILGGAEVGLATVEQRSNRTELSARGYDSTYWVIHGGYSHSLWSRERQKTGDSRLEATLRYVNRNGGELRQFFSYQQDVMQASASWVRRSSWGTFRLGAGYAW